MKSHKINPTKVILSAAGTTWLYRSIMALNGLISLPILMTGLGKTEYGIWVAIGQTAGLFALADFGVGNAVGRFVARFRGLDERQSIEKLIATSLLLMAAGSLIVIVLTFAIAPFISAILKIQHPYMHKAVVIFIISGFSLAIQLPFHIGIGLLTGFQRYGPHGIGKIATALLQLSGVLLLFAFHQVRLVPVAVVGAVAAITGQALLCVVAWKLTGPWKIRLSSFSKVIARDVFSLGSSSLVTTASNMGYRFGLSIVIARMINMEALAIYGVALTIMENIQPMISSFSTPFSTLASELHARERMDQLRKSIYAVMRGTFAAALSLVIGMYFFSEPVLRFLLHKSNWTAQDFISAKLCLTVMGIGLAIGLPQAISKSTLQGVGKHWNVSFSMIIFSVCSIIAAITSIHFGAGIVGAAIGWGLVWFLQGTFAFPFLIVRFLGQTLWSMAIECYVPGFAASIVILFCCLGVVRLFPPANIFNVLLSLILCCGISGIGIIVSSGYLRRIMRYAQKYLLRQELKP